MGGRSEAILRNDLGRAVDVLIASRLLRRCAHCIALLNFKDVLLRLVVESDPLRSTRMQCWPSNTRVAPVARGNGANSRHRSCLRRRTAPTSLAAGSTFFTCGHNLGSMREWAFVAALASARRKVTAWKRIPSFLARRLGARFTLRLALAAQSQSWLSLRFRARDLSPFGPGCSQARPRGRHLVSIEYSQGCRFG